MNGKESFLDSVAAAAVTSPSAGQGGERESFKDAERASRHTQTAITDSLGWLN